MNLTKRTDARPLGGLARRSAALALAAALVVSAVGPEFSQAHAIVIEGEAGGAAGAGFGAGLAVLAVLAQQRYGADTAIGKFASVDFSSQRGLHLAELVRKALPQGVLESMADQRLSSDAKLDWLAPALESVLRSQPEVAAQLESAPKLTPPVSGGGAVIGARVEDIIESGTRLWTARSEESGTVLEAASRQENARRRDPLDLKVRIVAEEMALIPPALGDHADRIVYAEFHPGITTKEIKGLLARYGLQSRFFGFPLNSTPAVLALLRVFVNPDRTRVFTMQIPLPRRWKTATRGLLALMDNFLVKKIWTDGAVAQRLRAKAGAGNSKLRVRDGQHNLPDFVPDHWPEIQAGTAWVEFKGDLSQRDMHVLLHRHGLREKRELADPIRAEWMSAHARSAKAQARGLNSLALENAVHAVYVSVGMAELMAEDPIESAAPEVSKPRS